MFRSTGISLSLLLGLAFTAPAAHASLPNEYERISLASITDAALEEHSENDMPMTTQVASNDGQGYYVYNAEPVKKQDDQAAWVASIGLALLISIGILHHLSLRAIAAKTPE